MIRQKIIYLPIKYVLALIEMIIVGAGRMAYGYAIYELKQIDFTAALDYSAGISISVRAITAHRSGEGAV